jgi:acetoin utilization deacetylase AcuC-like enzyme
MALLRRAPRPATTPTPRPRWAYAVQQQSRVAAAHALAAHGSSASAILDFDVHHGNGSQDIFEREPRVLFLELAPVAAVSRHRRRRARPGVGNIVNVPLAAV